MGRTATRHPRMLWSLLLILVGAALLLAAFVLAGGIPLAAHDDFGTLIQAQGGSLSSSATYPDTYRQVAAQSRMLQNAYLGVAGLVLLAAGVFGSLQQELGRH